MRIILLLPLLVGCTTVEDVRERDPYLQLATAKSVGEFGACLANQWSSRSGTVSTTPRPSGMTLTLTYAVFSNPLPAATVDVDDKGESRAVTVYARAADESEKLRDEVTSCA